MGFKGYRHTEEARQRISEARRKKMQEAGYINSPETRAKMSVAASRRRASDETRAKMSEAKKGKAPANLEKFLAAAHAAPQKHGEDHPSWRGDDVGYSGLHSWVRKVLGRPSLCDHCGSTTARKFEWANKSGQYRRDLSDWLRLCTTCHRKYDYAMAKET